MENKTEYIRKKISLNIDNFKFGYDPKIPLGTFCLPVRKPEHITEEQFNKDIKNISYFLSITPTENK